MTEQVLEYWTSKKQNIIYMEMFWFSSFLFLLSFPPSIFPSFF